MMARSNGKKVKVKIALAVDCEGNWGCAGGSGMSSRDALELATDGCGGYYKVYWLQAEIEAPRPMEVEIDLPAEAIVVAGQ